MGMNNEADGRRAFRVVGRVQGVGFRWWTRHTAVELGLHGWVRNESDGSVVVHAGGPSEALARLEEALRRGPSASRVDRLEAIAPAGSIEPGEFRIDI
jgi:acylphosphatase